MDKFRDWMHGKGRKIVILLLVLGAIWIILDDFMATHPEETASPAPAVLAPQNDKDLPQETLAIIKI